MKVPMKNQDGSTAYHIEVEDIDVTGHTIASQVIRTLMFNRKTRKLRTIDDIYKIVQNRYGPQCSPCGIHEYVKSEYISWIRHYVEMHSHIDDPEFQKNYPFAQKHFDKLCPDWTSVCTEWKSINVMRHVDQDKPYPN